MLEHVKTCQKEGGNQLVYESVGTLFIKALYQQEYLSALTINHIWKEQMLWSTMNINPQKISGLAWMKLP